MAVYKPAKKKYAAELPLEKRKAARVTKENC